MIFLKSNSYNLKEKLTDEYLINELQGYEGIKTITKSDDYDKYSEVYAKHSPSKSNQMVKLALYGFLKIIMKKNYLNIILILALTLGVQKHGIYTMWSESHLSES